MVFIGFRCGTQNIDLFTHGETMMQQWCRIFENMHWIAIDVQEGPMYGLAKTFCQTACVGIARLVYF
jgi:hypothetical protein